MGNSQQPSTSSYFTANIIFGAIHYLRQSPAKRRKLGPEYCCNSKGKNRNTEHCTCSILIPKHSMLLFKWISIELKQLKSEMNRSIIRNNIPRMHRPT